jgi:hypothetical protein
MTLVTVILWMTPAVGYNWSTPQVVGTGWCEKSRFAVDYHDRPWCIFNLMLPTFYHAIEGSFYLNDQWSDPAILFVGNPATGVGGFDAATAQDGKLWVLSCEEGGVTPPHITLYQDSVAWSDTIILPSDWGSGFHLAADSAGKMWTVFCGFEDYRIWCHVCHDTIWSDPQVVCSYPTYDQVGAARITVDPVGIRWVGAVAVSWPQNQIFFCRSDSFGAWSDSLIMGPSGPVELADMISDNHGNIWIAWHRDGGSIDYVYAAYLDTNYNWSPHYLITQGTFFGRCNVTVDNESKVWIVYDKGSNFFYRVWDGNSWSLEDSIVATPASSAFHGDLYYDPIRDRIWVSFRYDSGDIYVTWTSPSSNIDETWNKAVESSPFVFTNTIGTIFKIECILCKNESISLYLYDNLGKLIKKVFVGKKNPGRYSEEIDLKGYPCGVYHTLIETQNMTVHKKIVVVK